jgi:hypothetical protein
MSISPQPKSNEPSRPASPAADALEVLSLDEEAISPEEASKMKANQRKSSSWKGLKSQLSRAEMKIKSTFTEPFAKERKGSVIFYQSAADGTLLSPVELSPESVESGSSSPDQDVYAEREKNEKIADLIKNIEELGSECDNAVPKATNSAAAGNDKKESTVKRVDFVEEPCKKVSMSTIEGAGISRPTELSFSDMPVAPPRMKKDGSKRLERLLSVPNLKLNRQDQNRLFNLRKTSNIVDQKSNKNKGNFIRRFSKYQFQSFTHTQECFRSFSF